jgi:hypothetical protein
VEVSVHRVCRRGDGMGGEKDVVCPVCGQTGIEPVYENMTVKTWQQTPPVVRRQTGWTCTANHCDLEHQEDFEQGMVRLREQE